MAIRYVAQRNAVEDSNLGSCAIIMNTGVSTPMKDEFAPYRLVRKQTTPSYCGCWLCYMRGFTVRRCHLDKKHYHHQSRQRAKRALRDASRRAAQEGVAE